MGELVHYHNGNGSSILAFMIPKDLLNTISLHVSHLSGYLKLINYMVMLFPSYSLAGLSHLSYYVICALGPDA